MSTEQQESITSEHETVRTIATEMLDGRAFRGVSPSRWRPDIRAIIPDVIADLARQREALAGATDLGIGQEFERTIRSRVDFGGYSDSVQAEFGRWLREKATLFEGKPAIPDYPTAPNQLIQAHEQQLTRLRAWADNPEDDLMDGVDAQAQHLIEFPEPAWPTDDCRTNADAKTFLGRVMDYKRARLAPLVPAEGMRLLVDDRLNQGAYFVLGTVIEVVSTGSEEFGALGTCDFHDANGRVHAGQTLHAENLRQYHLVALPVEVGSDSEPADEPEVAQDPESRAIRVAHLTIEELRGEVQTLRTQVEELTQQIRNLTNQHLQDIDIIGEVLNAEAERRDWCDEYETVIERLNRRISTPLPVRADRDQEYEVEVTGWVRVPFACTISVTLASNAETSDIEDSAAEVFQENWSARELLGSYVDGYQAEVEDDPEYSVN